MDEQSAHQACAELRFAEGLRRRAEEARAEAAIREAASLALLEGARVPPSVLREAAHRTGTPHSTFGGEPDLAVGLGAWKAAWTITDTLPPLNQARKDGQRGADPLPLRRMFAGIQRDYGSYLASVGLARPNEVTLPKDPARWAALLQVIGDPKPTAIRTAARTWALLVIEDPFPTGSQVMGVLGAKWILATRGVEPTAVSVLSALAVERRGDYDAALDGVRAGDWEPWEQFFIRALIRGTEVGQGIARQVQAGTVGSASLT